MSGPPQGATRTALIVAGPTASGKSALALDLAERLGGVVINADAMQTYRDLRILTARPTPADEARVPHRLYGVREAAEATNAAWWSAAAWDEIEAADAADRVPILTGGTGMYLAALTQGIADIPPIPDDAREEARMRLAGEGAAALYAALAEADPDTAAGLRPSDSQRIARAWEVWRGTGRGLAAWHALPVSPRPRRYAMVLLDPPREELRAAIAGRFSQMLLSGALEEVRTLSRRDLHPALPILRAHGVPELAAHLKGEITLDEAAHRAGLATTQYTKRQRTWFRHRRLVDPNHSHTIHARTAGLAQLSESQRSDLLNFLKSTG